jgi:membrane protein implicated in regulation of membrane protease activity
MRKKAARVCLVVAVVWFILGAFVLGHAPEWFAISAAFAAVAASLGVRSVRISGVVLLVISVAVAVGAYEARQNWKLRVREIQQKAAEKESSNLVCIVAPTRAFIG